MLSHDENVAIADKESIIITKAMLICLGVMNRSALYNSRAGIIYHDIDISRFCITR